DDFGRAADMWDREKGQYCGDRPAGHKGLQPARYKVDAETDVRESHDAAHHEDNERTDHDWKNEPGLSFHGIPRNRLKRPPQFMATKVLWQEFLILNGITGDKR